MADKFEEVVLREKEKSFYISRIPAKTKNEIIQYANEYFAEDYGMAILFVWERFKEMIDYKDDFSIKLNYIIQLLETERINKTETEQKEKKPDNEIKMLSGRRVAKEVKNG